MRYQRLDVVLAMGLAGVINLSMLVVAAELFHGNGRPLVDTIEGAHSELGVLVGGGAALAFAVALLASGLSSSSVGTYAGQVVMQGFIRRRIPLFLRRAITMAPALVVLGVGLDPTTVLVISQVILSFGIPFALVPTILLTRQARPDGRPRQPALDDRGGDGGGRRDHLAERVPAVRDLLRLDRSVEKGAQLRQRLVGPLDEEEVPCVRESRRAGHSGSRSRAGRCWRQG